MNAAQTSDKANQEVQLQDWQKAVLNTPLVKLSSAMRNSGKKTLRELVDFKTRKLSLTIL